MGPSPPPVHDLEARARAEFEKLTREEVVAAIRRMRREGYSDHTIAAASRLGVEVVRNMLGELV